MPSLTDAREAASTDGGRVEAPDSDASPKPVKAAKAPKTPKVAVEPHDCKCQVPGCTGKTNRNFAPGHDAKLVGHLTRQVVAGEMTTSEAMQAVIDRAGASSLLVQKVKNAIQTEVDKRKAKEAAAAKAAEKPAEADKAAAEDVAVAVSAG